MATQEADDHLAAATAVRELARFAAITALLPLRRDTPEAANFHVPLRVRVLLEVLVRLPVTVVQRWRIGRRATVDRRVVWREWAGR